MLQPILAQFGQHRGAGNTQYAGRLSPVAPGELQGQRDMTPLRRFERIRRVERPRVEGLLEGPDIEQRKGEVNRQEVETRRRQRFGDFAGPGPGWHHLATGAERILQDSAPLRALGNDQAMEGGHDHEDN